MNERHEFRRDQPRSGITSTPNPDLSLRKITKVDMSCDDDLDVPYPLPPHHFAWLFVGKPKSGKTNLIINLITRKEELYHKQFNRVYFFSKSFHTVDKRLEIPKERVITTFDFETLHGVLDELESYNDSFSATNDAQPHSLIVLDDVVSKFKKGIDELQAMIFNRRHYHVSVMIVAQVYNKVPLELRKCCDTLSIFYTGHRGEMRNIWEEYLGHLTKEQVFELWDYVFDREFMFLMVRADIVPARNGLFKNFDQITLSPHINNSRIRL